MDAANLPGREDCEGAFKLDFLAACLWWRQPGALVGGLHAACIVARFSFSSATHTHTHIAPHTATKDPWHPTALMMMILARVSLSPTSSPRKPCKCMCMGIHTLASQRPPRSTCHKKKVPPRETLTARSFMVSVPTTRADMLLVLPS